MIMQMDAANRGLVSPRVWRPPRLARLDNQLMARREQTAGAADDDDKRVIARPTRQTGPDDKF